MNLCRALPMPPSSLFRKQKLHRHHSSTHNPILPPIKPNSPNRPTKIINVDDIKPIEINLAYSSSQQKSDLEFDELPSLIQAPSTLKSFLFEGKIKICSHICNFTNPNYDVKAKLIKSSTLSELYTFIQKNSLTQKQIDQLLEMIFLNISRRIDIPKIYFPLYEDLIIIDSAWTHLSIIYSILEKISNISLTYNERFLSFLTKLLKVPSSREFDKINLCLLIVCKRFPESRQFIRNNIIYNLLNYIDGDYSYRFSISGILFLLYSIICISNSKSNQKLENSLLLSSIEYKMIILPLLHKDRLKQYISPILQIIWSFIDKNPQSLLCTIDYMLDHFPLSCTFSQAAYLRILLTLLQSITNTQFKPFIFKFSRILSLSLDSAVISVVEAALGFFTDVQVMNLLSYYSSVMIKPISQALKQCAMNHWDLSIQNSAIGALQQIKSLKHNSFPMNTKYHNHEDINAKIHRNWVIIARQAAVADPDTDLHKILQEINDLYKESKSVPHIKTKTSSYRTIQLSNFDSDFF